MKIKTLILSLALAMGFTFSVASCNNSSSTNSDDNKENDSQNQDEESGDDKKEDEEEIITPVSSEKTMENFLKNVDCCSYSIENTDYIKQTFYSKDLVYIDYVPSNFADPVYMTVNTDETFKAHIENNAMKDGTLEFIDEGHAADVLYEQSLAYWNQKGSNIWDSFTNYAEEPLKFLMVNSELKLQVAKYYTDIGETSMSRLSDVYLILDDEEATSGTIKVTFTEDIHAVMNDIDIKLDFSISRPETLPTDSWINNESREYPTAKTAWDDTDVSIFNVVFNQGYYIESKVPFPSFASYAFHTDYDTVYNKGIICIRDKYTTEAQINTYISELQTKGFRLEIEEVNGVEENWYHYTIKDYDNGSYCYISVQCEYNNGFNMTIKKYFLNIEYDNISDINGVIGVAEFPEFEATLTNATAVDYTYEYKDGYAGLFNFVLVLDVKIVFDTEQEQQNNMMIYLADLDMLGYEKVDTSENDKYSVSTETVRNSVEYLIEDDNKTVRFLFKHETFFSDSEAMTATQDNGLLEIDVTKYNSHCSEISELYMVMYNQAFDYILEVTLSFDKDTELTSFLTELEGLLAANGYDKVSNDLFNLKHKDIVYYNSSTSKVVCFNNPSNNFISLHLIDASIS